MLRLDFNLVFTILNILIWYVLIRKFLFKPINNIITKREEALNARYDEVKQLQAEAKAEKDKSVQYQNQIESEKAKVMAQAQLDARKEFDQIVEAYKRMHEECKEIEKIRSCVRIDNIHTAGQHKTRHQRMHKRPMRLILPICANDQEQDSSRQHAHDTAVFHQPLITS